MAAQLVLDSSASGNVTSSCRNRSQWSSEHSQQLLQQQQFRHDGRRRLPTSATQRNSTSAKPEVVAPTAQQSAASVNRRAMTGYQCNSGIDTSGGVCRNRPPTTGSSSSFGPNDVIVVSRQLSDDNCTTYGVVHPSSYTDWSHEGLADRLPVGFVVGRCSWSPKQQQQQTRRHVPSSGVGEAWNGNKLSRAASEHSLHAAKRSTGVGTDYDMLSDPQWYYSDVERRRTAVSGAVSPPRIAPVSGRLSMEASQMLIRPVPCKPAVVTPPRHHNLPPTKSTSLHSCDVITPPNAAGNLTATGSSSLTSKPTAVVTSSSSRLQSTTDDGYVSSSRDTCTHGNWSSSSEDSSHRTQSDASHVIFSGGHLDTVDSPDPDVEIDDDELLDHRQQQQPKRRQSAACVGTSSSLSGVSAQGLHHRRMSASAAVQLNDLESALRGKEAELRRLRETMEKNETAIVEVLQERRRSWQAQMTSLSAEWERKLRCEQQKSLRTEQSLLVQVFRLQNENKALRQQQQQQQQPQPQRGEQSSVSSSTSSQDSDELRAARTRLDELRWELDERSCEADAMRARALGAEARLERVESDLVVTRQNASEAMERADEAERRSKEAELDRFAAVEALDRVQAELQRVREITERETEEYERERKRWLDEKRRVIDYQKQLQLNYVQMARKNRQLEMEVEQLTAEIDAQTERMTTVSPSSGGRRNANSNNTTAPSTINGVVTSVATTSAVANAAGCGGGRYVSSESFC